MNRTWRIVVATVTFCAGIHIVAAADGTIYMSQTAPYSDSKAVAQAILQECDLPAQQAQLLHAAANERGIVLVLDDAAVKAGKGRVLHVEITNAVSSGNAFIGHRKQVAVKGRLLEDGTEIGTFSGLRHSGGGFAAGFKGSCTVLNRCAKALAKDITLWLANPRMDARIGE